jgi:ATP-dependent RNA helicase DeaD
MDSFEELGLPPELVEALAAEGIERPTPLQEAAIPVLRRGNNLLLAAGPGSGTLVAWGAAALERIDPDVPGTAALVLTPTPESAQRLAESLQRMGAATGHSVAALGSPWALPARAHVLFGTPGEVLGAAAAGEIDLSSVTILVVDQADRIERLAALGPVEEVLGFLPKDGQRVVLALPLTPGVEDFVERHARRAATVPPRPADGSLERTSVERGTLRFRVVSEPREEGLLATVAQLLADDFRHVLVYCRSEDRAADVGDYLTLHGYVAGAPGDAAVPVWLGVQELTARSATEGVSGVTVVSYDVPADPDSLDRRHGKHDGGIVLLAPRELAHLRDVARRTGYALEPAPLPARRDDDASRFREMLARAAQEEDISPYLLLLEPLFERMDPAEVAAAAVALLRKKAPPAPPRPTSHGGTSAAARETPTAWVKVFLTVGERDGLTAKDLVGAITGEADIPGSNVGKIEIRESHAVVEVMEPVAKKVIAALNGTTIRGRSVRADFDRPRSRQGQAGERRGGPPRGRPPRRS